MLNSKYSDKIVKDTRKKFFIFSFLGIALVSIISLIGFQYHRYVVNHQYNVQRLNISLNRQMSYVNSIAKVSQRFEKELSRSEQKKLVSKFSELLRKLESESTTFKSFVSDKNYKSFKNIKVLFDEGVFKQKVKVYTERAQELIDDSSASVSEIKNDILFLSENSKAGLTKTYFEIEKAIQKEDALSLKDLDRMGILLILLCFLEVALVWLLVFRPLYKTVIQQHDKMNDSILEVETANRSRNEFLANISHEIRTPMTGILGYVERLESLDNMTKEEVAEAVSIIDKNSTHLLSLIDEILDIAKIESGKMNVEFSDCNLRQQIHQVETLIKVKAEEKSLDLQFYVSDELPHEVNIDPKRFRQILLNIIGNAVKFTERGYVHVHCEYQKVDKDNFAVFEIKDTGPGIPTKGRKKLFKAFEQADGSHERSHGGTGLGLVLARGLARQMGGDVVILHTEIGQGTTFRIHVNLGARAHLSKSTQAEKRDPAPIEDKNSKSALADCSLLVVDDARENVALFKIYLEAAGASVVTAHSGIEAINQCVQNKFDLILMDIQMPLMDGYEALKKIRELGVTIPILALTAHALPAEKKKCLAAGFNDHITKPIRSEALIMQVKKNL